MASIDLFALAPAVLAFLHERHLADAPPVGRDSGPGVTAGRA